MSLPTENEIRDAFANVRYDVPASKMVSRALRRRHRRRMAMGAVPAVGLLAAAGYALRSEPTSEVFTVGCYGSLNQQANTTILKWEKGMTPAEVCLSEPTAFGKTVPQQVLTCVVNGGGTGVFPKPQGLDPEEACASIGAAIPAEGPHYGGLTAAEVRAMDADLARKTGSLNDPAATEACYPAEDLEQTVSAFLQERGLEQWTVKNVTTDQAALASNGQRCGDLVLDELQATFLIVDGNRKGD